MAGTKSQSVEYRESGNRLYVGAFDESLPYNMQEYRLKNALTWYEKAKNCTTRPEEMSAVSKNIALASKKLACLLSHQNKSVNERHYYFKESIVHFDLAYRYANINSKEWVNTLFARFLETIQDAIRDVNLLDVEQQVKALNDYAHCLTCNLRAELLTEIARIRFHHGLACLQNGDYRACLHQLAECYWPMEEARRFGESIDLTIELRILDNDVFIHKCIAESTQARIKGDSLFETLINDEEYLNMDLVWSVVDLYKEAIILSRENDLEVEAIALSRLGNIRDKILKDKLKAKESFMRAIQLAMALQPRTFDSEDWFKLCHNVLERYQKEIIEQESEKWNRERAQYLAELKVELLKVEAAGESGLENLLRYIYEHHPPKASNMKLGDIPDKASSNYRNEMKSLSRNAVIHYHPDRANVTKNGKAWKVLCEEICKMLTQHYEMLK